MILTISTIERDKFSIGLFTDNNLNCFDFVTGDQSADILPAIEGVLKNHKIELKDITAIAVNQGPGSFTGVRVGVSVANALAWSLNIPVVGYRDGEFEATLIKIAKNSKKKFSKIVLPYYPEK